MSAGAARDRDPQRSVSQYTTSFDEKQEMVSAFIKSFSEVFSVSGGGQPGQMRRSVKDAAGQHDAPADHAAVNRGPHSGEARAAFCF